MKNFETGLWRGLPPALACEIGALVVIAFGAAAGLVAGVAALVALMIVARLLPAPGTSALRPLVLIAGPPLRFALLLAAVLVVWLPRAQGPLPAVGCLVVLGLVLPAVASGTEAVVARLRPSAA
jgi:hypothetical protein